jgi:putative acetyltransferase
MRESARIRRFVPGEEALLFQVYFTSIHLVACRDYSPEQVEAWAPQDLDRESWQKKIREINPFVAGLLASSLGIWLCTSIGLGLLFEGLPL